MEALWDTCDNDAEIRKALANLPKGLRETYRRCLHRIGCQSRYAPKVLEWVSYAIRPLRIDELREAVAFDLQDRARSPDKIPNSTSVIGCCANLVVLDATDGCIRFAHPSVKQYLEENQGDENVPYPANPEQGELNCGEYCVAYLSFSDFGLHLEKSSDVELPFQPPDLEAILTSGLFGAIASKFNKLVASKSDHKRTPILLRMGRKRASKPDQKQYDFLDYAVQNWATQTKMITSQSVVWDRFRQLAMNPNESWNLHPWIPEGRSLGSHLHGLLGWAVKEHHMPFLEILLGLEYRGELRKVCNLPLIGGSLPALHVASRLGSETVAKLLLEVCRVNTLDGEGCTAVHHAAEKGHLGIAKLLSNAKGALVDMLSKHSRTPLWLAASSGHEQIVSLLIKKGANLKAYGPEVLTPLSVAALNGHEAIVKLLTGRGAELGFMIDDHHTSIFTAAKNGHEAIVKLFIENEIGFQFENDQKRTPLFLAAQNGHKAVVKMFIEKAVDLGFEQSYVQTTLMYAAENGHAATVKLLIEKSVYPDFTYDFGQTLLLSAARNGHETVVKLLIEQNVDLECKNEFKQTALHIATLYGHEAVVKLLIGKNVDLECKDTIERTPLLYAAEKGHEAIVKLLIEKGAKSFLSKK